MGYIIFAQGKPHGGIGEGFTLKLPDSHRQQQISGEGLIMAKGKEISCGIAAASGAEETVSGSSCCDCVKHKYRDVNSKEYKQMIRRLRLIEGQVRGIEKMVEEDRYCIDILIQVSAIQSALNAFNKELLAQHIHSCVVDDIRNGKDEVVDELVAAVQKLMK